MGVLYRRDKTSGGASASDKLLLRRRISSQKLAIALSPEVTTVVSMMRMRPGNESQSRVTIPSAPRSLLRNQKMDRFRATVW